MEKINIHKQMAIWEANCKLGEHADPEDVVREVRAWRHDITVLEVHQVLRQLAGQQAPGWRTGPLPQMERELAQMELAEEFNADETCRSDAPDITTARDDVTSLAKAQRATSEADSCPPMHVDERLLRWLDLYIQLWRCNKPVLKESLIEEIATRALLKALVETGQAKRVRKRGGGLRLGADINLSHFSQAKALSSSVRVSVVCIDFGTVSRHADPQLKFDFDADGSVQSSVVMPGEAYDV